MKTLYLAWQAPVSRAWFPIGRLDANALTQDYRFRYTNGALDAEERDGFQPLYSFPEFRQDYRSAELFPLFQNRVLGQKRSEYPTFLDWLGLDSKSADPMDILAVSGGERATDSLEVFPRIEKDAEGGFQVRFFVHGLRHLPETSQERAGNLKSSDKLRVMVELNNPATRTAITLNTEDYHMLGWAPRYLVNDLLSSISSAPKLVASVLRVNRIPAPINRRVLVKLCGQMPATHDPMSSLDFQPLVDDVVAEREPNSA